MGKRKGKWMQGNYTPKNPEKYVGKMPIVYRSSWELEMCRVADMHPSIKFWSSESMRIPYYNPILGKHSVYVPDFFLVYEDKGGKRHAEVIEIKPKRQMLMDRAKTVNEKAVVAVNLAKWEAAKTYCKRKGIKFRVMTEDNLFGRKK